MYVFGFVRGFMGKKLCDEVLFMHIVDTQLKLFDMYVNDYWNKSTLYTT